MAGMETQRAIVITGPVGAGKTTTAATLAEMLEKRDVSCAAIDMDALRWFHPTPADDPFGTAVGYRHLAFMAETYRSMGIPTLILADVVETSEDRRKLAEALKGYSLVIVRLDVALERMQDRLRQRESEAQLAWHLNRASELQGIMERNGIGDIVVAVDAESPEEVAVTIAKRLRLL